MMYSYNILLLLFCSGALCQNNCVREDFELGLSAYNNDKGICIEEPGPKWTLGDYSSLTNITRPHADSKSFITLSTPTACMTSPLFTMIGGGIIEIKGYVEKSDSVKLEVFVYRHNFTGPDEFLGAWQVWSGRKEAGWQIFTVRIPGSEKFEGYMSITAKTSSPGLVLIDSFRFIATQSEFDTCVTYARPSGAARPSFGLGVLFFAWLFSILKQGSSTF